MKTVPRGFSALPPLGPAMPVSATPMSASKRARTPWAIARAHWALTDTPPLIIDSGTFSSSILGLEA